MAAIEDNFKPIQPVRPQDKKENMFLDTLLQETDRGLVLVAATFLDNILRDCLDAKFTNEKSSREVRQKLIGEKKTDTHAVFSEFGRKTMVCRAFGLIGEDEFGVLEAIRKIRNACAHEDFLITLADPDLAGYVSKLADYGKNIGKMGSEDAALPVGSIWKAILTVHGITPSDLPTPKAIFLGTTINLYMNLCHICSILKGEHGSACIL